jgi:hypothetical protein
MTAKQSPTRVTELERHLAQAWRAFKQNPQPRLATAMCQLMAALRYERNLRP